MMLNNEHPSYILGWNSSYKLMKKSGVDTIKLHRMAIPEVQEKIAVMLEQRGMQAENSDMGYRHGWESHYDSILYVFRMKEMRLAGEKIVSE